MEILLTFHRVERAASEPITVMALSLYDSFHVSKLVFLSGLATYLKTADGSRNVEMKKKFVECSPMMCKQPL